MTQVHHQERQTALEKNKFMPSVKRSEGRPEFRWSDNQIWLDGGVIRSQADADSVIKFIEALRPMLKAAESPTPEAKTEPEMPGVPLIAAPKDDPHGG